MDELYALIEANRASLARWLPWAAGQDRGGTLEFIRLARRQRADNAGATFAIVCGGALAGVIGMEPLDWAHRATSIGYWLGEGHRGRGVMTRAVRALVDHAVFEWDLNRVEIRAAVGNAPSRAIPARLGFPRGGDAPPGRARRRRLSRQRRLLDARHRLARARAHEALRRLKALNPPICGGAARARTPQARPMRCAGASRRCADAYTSPPPLRHIAAAAAVAIAERRRAGADPLQRQRALQVPLLPPLQPAVRLHRGPPLEDLIAPQPRPAASTSRAGFGGRPVSRSTVSLTGAL